MDLAFDLDDAEHGGPGSGKPGSARHPSWPELRARLHTALQASDSLAREIRADSPFYLGSFDEAAAACVASHGEPYHSVNPKDLGNRKSRGTTVPPVAGHTRTGGRG